MGSGWLATLTWKTNIRKHGGISFAIHMRSTKIEHNWSLIKQENRDSQTKQAHSTNQCESHDNFGKCEWVRVVFYLFRLAECVFPLILCDISVFHFLDPPLSCEAPLSEQLCAASLQRSLATMQSLADTCGRNGNGQNHTEKWEIMCMRLKETGGRGVTWFL